MAKVFAIDVAKCTGCYNCQYACKDEHVGNDWAPIARPQPEIGQFWMNVKEYVRGTIPKVKAHYIPSLCNHCENAPCMAASEKGAVYRREDGLVIIDTDKAKGQRQIADACPYGVVYWNEELALPQKCTGCAHLLDNGYKKPRCVEVCPTEALRFGEEEELSDFIHGATVMLPESGTSPRVYYRNIPGQFIAGTVYDPETKEVVIGAKIRALSGGKRLEVTTNGYGDFWLKDLDVGTFDIYISAKGYDTKVILGVNTEQCVNLGDVPMSVVKS